MSHRLIVITIPHAQQRLRIVHLGKIDLVRQLWQGVELGYDFFCLIIFPRMIIEFRLFVKVYVLLGRLLGIKSLLQSQTLFIECESLLGIMVDIQSIIRHDAVII